MNVTIRLFAVARQLASRETVSLELSPGATIGQLRRQLAADVPDLAPMLPHVLFAIGTRYVGNDETIPDGSQIACIPPVSGG